MVRRGAYQPDRGDLVWLDFTPHAGTEQGGRRPALVLSGQDFNIATGLAYVCPITNQGKGSSFEVPLPKGAKLTGFALSDNVRSVDWIARKAELHGTSSMDFLHEVLGRLEAILAVDLR
jgi:mRNA interferase MazF